MLRFIGIATRIVETVSSIRERALRIGERSARISGEIARMSDSSRCIAGSDLLMRGSCAHIHRKQSRICVGDGRLVGIDQAFCATALLRCGATLESCGPAERIPFESHRLLGGSRRLCAKR